MSDHVFGDLPSLLAPGDLVVVNDTRVRSARLVGERDGTGGKVELLLLERTDDGSWMALARPARRLRQGVVVRFGDLTATVLANLGEGMVTVELEASEKDLEEAVEREGSLPLPPYFTGHLPAADRYQTVYAAKTGSAAAPTAGLHFTSDVFDELGQRGIEVASVDLHVSLDTFRPMNSEDIDDHVMHSEWCEVPEKTAQSIDQVRERGGRVVAVGTTVVRTLETFSTGGGRVDAGGRDTSLFLRPGSQIDVVDLLITNFHMPGSTLLVLLAAFMGEEWRMAYETALSRGYRFLSFGDAMLAQRSPS